MVNSLKHQSFQLWEGGTDIVMYSGRCGLSGKSFAVNVYYSFNQRDDFTIKEKESQHIRSRRGRVSGDEPDHWRFVDAKALPSCSVGPLVEKGFIHQRDFSPPGETPWN